MSLPWLWVKKKRHSLRSIIIGWHKLKIQFYSMVLENLNRDINLKFICPRWATQMGNLTIAKENSLWKNIPSIQDTLDLHRKSVAKIYLTTKNHKTPKKSNLSWVRSWQKNVWYNIRSPVTSDYRNFIDKQE